MKRIVSALIFLLGLSALATYVAAQSSVAQDQPNLSGTWNRDVSREVQTLMNARVSENLHLGPSPASLIISQDEKTITVQEYYSGSGPAPKYAVQDPFNLTLYPLDGRTVTNQIQIAEPLTRAPAVLTSQWKDNQLAATFTVSVPGEAAPRRYEQTIALNPDGRLVFQVKASGAPHARIVVFRRLAGLH
jgi:hypothetical protein